MMSSWVRAKCPDINIFIRTCSVIMRGKFSGRHNLCQPSDVEAQAGPVSGSNSISSSSQPPSLTSLDPALTQIAPPPPTTHHPFIPPSTLLSFFFFFHRLNVCLFLKNSIFGTSSSVIALGVFTLMHSTFLSFISCSIIRINPLFFSEGLCSVTFQSYWAGADVLQRVLILNLWPCDTHAAVLA